MATEKQRERLQREEQRDELMETAGETGTSVAVIAAGASVLLSWYQFYVRGKKLQGLFMGLWPPTILAFASYFEQKRTSEMLERSLGSGSLMRAIRQQLMGE